MQREGLSLQEALESRGYDSEEVEHDIAALLRDPGTRTGIRFNDGSEVSFTADTTRGNSVRVTVLGALALLKEYRDNSESVAFVRLMLPDYEGLKAFRVYVKALGRK